MRVRLYRLSLRRGHSGLRHFPSSVCASGAQGSDRFFIVRAACLSLGNFVLAPLGASDTGCGMARGKW